MRSPGQWVLPTAGMALLLAACGWASAAQPTRALSYGTLPLAFEANHGQAGGSARFLVKGTDSVLGLGDRGVTISLAGGATARIRFLGAAVGVSPEGLDRLPGVSHYYLGDDPQGWRTYIPNYRRVRYSGLCPGIDLVLYGSLGQLEYDWVVEPGGDPSRIGFRVEGAEAVEIDATGDLVARLGGREIRHRRPVAYQEVQGRRAVIPASFRSLGGEEFGFAVGPYDRTKRLVIDPILVYTARPAGLGAIEGTAIAIDAAGNAYFAGATYAYGPPGPDGTPQIGSNVHGFIGKFNAAGDALLYSIYVASPPPAPFTADRFGNVYTAWGHALVTKLNPTGEQVWRTGLTGSGQSRSSGIVVDSAGNVYVAGSTTSPDFPTTPGALQAKLAGAGPDGFMVKYSPSGAVVYATYLGGTDSDDAYAIAVDSAGNAYVTGQTRSLNFPVTAGAFQTKFVGGPPGGLPASDAFVAKLNPQGSALVYSTYLGGHGQDEGLGIAVDAAGDAYVTGYTATGNTAADFPTTREAVEPSGGIGSAGFVSKLNPSGSALVYSTYVGGAICHGIGVDGMGNAYIAGTSNLDRDFKTFRAFQDRSYPVRSCYWESGWPMPCAIGVVRAFEPSGQRLLYSTFLGDPASEANAIAVDSAGNAYVTGKALTLLPAVGGFKSNQGYLFLAKIAPGGTPPFIPFGGITNAASFKSGYAAGGLVTIFGSGLTNVSGVRVAASVPLPTELEGTSVLVNGKPAPILAVANVDGREQINLQIPFEAFPPPAEFLGWGSNFEVRNQGLSGYAVAIENWYVGPGIFVRDGQPAIQHAADFSLVTDSNPAAKGEVIVVYAAGLGSTEPAVPSGYPAPASPVAWTVWTPGVVIAGIRAEVLFSGLTPGFVGLYQVNVRVPEGVPSGKVDLVIGEWNSDPPAHLMFPGNTVKVAVR